MLVFALMPVISAAEEETPQKLPPLEVHFIDVGRNDGILIRVGDECAFIDGGLPMFTKMAYDYMTGVGVTQLKYYIATHAHSDHVGGAPALLAVLPTETVLYNSALTRSTIEEFAKNAAQKSAVESVGYQEFYCGDTVTLGEATLTCILPVQVRPLSSRTDGTENCNSIVIRLTYGENVFLLTADTINDNLLSLLETNPELIKCDVLKNPHHENPIDKTFLAATGADYVVYSTSDDYMPETWDVRKVLSTGARVFITNKKNAGTTVFYSDGENITVETANSPGKWKVSTKGFSMKKGGTARITYEISSKYMDTLHWSTSDESMVSFEYGTGRVKIFGHKAGECTVTATAFDGTTWDIQVKIR